MKKTLILATLLASSAAICAFGQQADIELQNKINKGFQIAPVPLNLTGRDANLVGYGSYLVNAVGECNGCHSAGAPTAFTPGGNPSLGQYAKVNPATYLGGGNDFGAFPDPQRPAGAAGLSSKQGIALRYSYIACKSRSVIFA